MKFGYEITCNTMFVGTLRPDGNKLDVIWWSEDITDYSEAAMQERYKRVEFLNTRAALTAAPVQPPGFVLVPEEIVSLTRIAKAIEFYSRREHWMSMGEDGVRTLVTALGSHTKKGNGWEEAEAVKDDLWAVEQLITQLSQTKAECLATIDYMNAQKAAAPSPPHEDEIEAEFKWDSSKVLMMAGKPCQSAVRELAEIAMRTMNADTRNFRERDKVISAIAPLFEKALRYAAQKKDQP